MNSHLEYLEQWFCETSIGCVPKVQIITGLLIVFINLYFLRALRALRKLFATKLMFCRELSFVLSN